MATTLGTSAPPLWPVLSITLGNRPPVTIPADQLTYTAILALLNPDSRVGTDAVPMEAWGMLQISFGPNRQAPIIKLIVERKVKLA